MMYTEKQIARMAIREFYSDRWHGKKILDRNGITFTHFKNRVSVMLTWPSVVSKGEWFEHWKEYCRWTAQEKGDLLTPEEFAKEFYQAWVEETHGCELKTKRPSILDEL